MEVHVNDVHRFADGVAWRVAEILRPDFDARYQTRRVRPAGPSLDPEHLAVLTYLRSSNATVIDDRDNAAILAYLRDTKKKSVGTGMPTLSNPSERNHP